MVNKDDLYIPFRNIVKSRSNSVFVVSVTISLKITKNFDT